MIRIRSFVSLEDTEYANEDLEFIPDTSEHVDA